ncbi:retinol dehydrogenase 7-like [Saccoglossus kowalevskii]
MLLYVLYFIAFVVFYQILQWVVRKPTISGIPDKYVFITGCDTGFGNMLTKRLDKTGFHVYAACLTQDGCRSLKQSTSSRVTTLQMDVTNTQSIRQAYERVSKLIPPNKGLWGLVNNAGISGISCPYEWLQKEDYQQVINVNLLGMIDVTTIFLPLVKKTKGRIVNITSSCGRYVVPGGCYSISKFGAEAFCDGLRIMLHPFGVRVHIIEPGFFATNILDEDKLLGHITRIWNKLPKEIKKEYGDNYVEEFRSSTKDTVTRLVSPRTDKVINAFEHALTSWWPRTRYIVGFDANFLLIPITFLPAFITDVLHRAIAKQPIPEACTKR